MSATLFLPPEVSLTETGYKAGSAWLAAALCFALVAPGCGRGGKKPIAMAEPPKASAVVRGASSGLELWWWVVTDQRIVHSSGPATPAKPGDPPPPPAFRIVETGESIETLLAPYVNRPVPISDDLKKRWRECGLRAVCVPIKDLETIEGSLRLTGPVQRQWLGELSAWTDVIRGPEFSSSRVVMLGDKPEELQPGRLRLMARCWTYPVTAAAGSPTAAFRLELVPQFEPETSDRSRLHAAGVVTTVPEEDQTRMFTELQAGLAIDARAGEPDAIVIVPDRPDADWTKHVDPLNAEDGDAGPTPEVPATLGETMLSVPAIKQAPRARAVVILIPRLPERFELLGR